MYYVAMTDGLGSSIQTSRIIAMSEKKKYIENFITFFFKGSKNYEILCSPIDSTEKDPDLYTIVKISKEEKIYLPVWMIRYIENEFNSMTFRFIKSMGYMHTICKNNGDSVGMECIQNFKDHFFKKNDAFKESFVESYVYMHWICVVPFDKHKMEILDQILSCMEYNHDMDSMYRTRLFLDYT